MQKNMSPILSNRRKNERGIYRNNPRRKYNKMLTVIFLVSAITGYSSSLYIFSIFCSISFNFYNVKVINPKKWRKTIEWERLEISSRKSEIPREHFMQRWAQ